jgi:hypothetical protein
MLIIKTIKYNLFVDMMIMSGISYRNSFSSRIIVKYYYLIISLDE